MHDPPVVLFIGELLERKGVVTLLDALDQLDARGVGDYELRIIGDNRPGLDPDKDAMVAEIERRGRGATMTGPLSRAEVYANLSEADLYVFPTWTEGQPFTVIEALSSGVPIVASDIQAISAMIEDPTHGRLLDMHDVDRRSRTPSASCSPIRTSGGASRRPTGRGRTSASTDRSSAPASPSCTAAPEERATGPASGRSVRVRGRAATMSNGDDTPDAGPVPWGGGSTGGRGWGWPRDSC